MFSSQQLQKYEPPTNQAPSKVHRFQVYRRSASKPASPPPPPPPPKAKDPPKEEKPAPPPPTWSEWQLIREPQWEGYWRASALKDGGWHYQFTKDGTTIWEQKVPKPDGPEPVSSKAPAKNEATAKPAPPSAPPKQPHPSTSLTKSSHGHGVKTVAVPPATAPAKVNKSANTLKTTTTTKTTEIIPSYTVTKPDVPKPPAPPKKVPKGTITLHTKGGKAVTIPLPDPGKPVVIRTLMEK